MSDIPNESWTRKELTNYVKKHGYDVKLSGKGRTNAAILKDLLQQINNANNNTQQPIQPQPQSQPSSQSQRQHQQIHTSPPISTHSSRSSIKSQSQSQSQSQAQLNPSQSTNAKQDVQINKNSSFSDSIQTSFQNIGQNFSEWKFPQKFLLFVKNTVTKCSQMGGNLRRECGEDMKWVCQSSLLTVSLIIVLTFLLIFTIWITEYLDGNLETDMNGPNMYERKITYELLTKSCELHYYNCLPKIESVIDCIEAVIPCVRMIFQRNAFYTMYGVNDLE